MIQFELLGPTVSSFGSVVDTISDGSTNTVDTESPFQVTNVASLLELLNNGIHISASARVQPLGFTPLDNVLGGGLRMKDLLVIAGRPGVGKTILSLQMARNLAMHGGTAIYACYEHDAWTLLTRLLALELGSIGVPSASSHRRGGVRSVLDEVISGRVSLASVCSDPVLRAAVSRLNSYADRLHFVEASPSSTSVEGLEKTVAKLREGPTTLFIDYLQKVFVKDANKSYSEHVGLITAGLKEMSIQRSISVVAIAAIGDHGLYKRRTHLPDLDAAVAVGYDADVIIMLNDKRPIVSSHNLSYTTDQEDRFRQRIVFTVAKNRGGIAPIDLEFTKDFEHFRFDPEGSFVTEQLIEDREHDDLRS